MKRTAMLVCMLVVAGCAAKTDKPAALGMKNPAAVYCVEQGGKQESAATSKGEVSFCLLPTGERIEQWALYRRDHKK
ncbi:DUF333 domain-containing protein [Pantoea sp. MBD-2R]|uniref:putative hemolysin n=1 Tax=Pantoea sp. MBD-2R TaxID=3141540 RepID=UPI0031843B7F